MRFKLVTGNWRLAACNWLLVTGGLKTAFGRRVVSGKLSQLRKVKKIKNATKTPGHQVSQSFKYQCFNLSGAL
jgi:hypothetical protein